MPYVSMAFGGLLCLLGAYAFANAEKQSITALIPAFEGLILLAAGVAALNEKMLKHAMHAAALVGLLGLVGGAVQFLRLQSAGEPVTSLKSVASGGMAALSLLFVAACVNSFIQARRRRAAAQASA
jgi:uncharacterized membrane protein